MPRYSEVAPIDLAGDTQLEKLACQARHNAHDAPPRIAAAYTALAAAFEAVRAAFKPEPPKVQTIKRRKPMKRRNTQDFAAEDRAAGEVSALVKKQSGGNDVVILNSKGERVR